jgi:transposase
MHSERVHDRYARHPVDLPWHGQKAHLVVTVRRRHSYATLPVDLETHRPIDLVQGRDAETFAPWLKEHPGVAIISRDRAEAYAEGATAGAPDAVQVVDRFHLLQNASSALDAMLRGRRLAVD